MVFNATLWTHLLAIQPTKKMAMAWAALMIQGLEALDRHVAAGERAAELRRELGLGGVKLLAGVVGPGELRVFSEGGRRGEADEQGGEHVCAPYGFWPDP